MNASEHGKVVSIKKSKIETFVDLSQLRKFIKWRPDKCIGIRLSPNSLKYEAFTLPRPEINLFWSWEHLSQWLITGTFSKYSDKDNACILFDNTFLLRMWTEKLSQCNKICQEMPQDQLRKISLHFHSGNDDVWQILRIFRGNPSAEIQFRIGSLSHSVEFETEFDKSKGIIKAKIGDINAPVILTDSSSTTGFVLWFSEMDWMLEITPGSDSTWIQA